MHLVICKNVCIRSLKITRIIKLKLLIFIYLNKVGKCWQFIFLLHTSWTNKSVYTGTSSSELFNSKILTYISVLWIVTTTSIIWDILLKNESKQWNSWRMQMRSKAITYEHADSSTRDQIARSENVAAFC